MLILAFESSAKAASVALVRDGSLVSQYSQCSALTHSRTLLPMAEDILFSCHDHQLTQTVANRIIEITDDGVIDRLCSYDEYMHIAEANKQ